MSRDQPQPPPQTAVAKVCSNCCSDDRWILHNVRYRGLYRKLCTSCVLKLHPSSFCPTCFSLHDHHPTTTTTGTNNHRTLTCFKCSSLSHATCVPPNAPKSPYLCPPCSLPSFKFFDLKKPPGKNSDGVDGSNVGSDPKVPGEHHHQQVIDQRSAKVLLAAAKIAAISMNRAAASARAEAERRVKEAALARKRAKEAIDHVMLLSARVVIKRSRDGPIEGSKGANVGPVRVEKNGVGRNVGGGVNVGAGAGGNTANGGAVQCDNKNVDKLNNNNNNSTNGAVPGVASPVVAGSDVGSGSQHLENHNGSNNHVGVKDSKEPQ